MSILIKKRDVACSLQFIQIGEVDTVNERFQATIVIKARWSEINLPDNSLNKDIPSKDWKEWEPKLFIENASYDKNNIEEITYFATKLYNTIQVTETRLFRGSFWERMELNSFPFDIQDLTISVGSKRSSNFCRIIADSTRLTLINNQMYSALNDQVIKSFRDQQKYKLYQLVTIKDAFCDSSLSSKPRKEIKKIYLEINETKSFKPKFVAKVQCSRRSPFYLVNNFLFNFLITLLSMTLFSIEAKNSQARLGGTFTLILTSFSFKVVTSKSLPTIAYLTSLDKYQLVNIFYLATCCVWHAVCASFIHNDKKVQFDRIALYSLASIFLFVQIFFIIYLFISSQKVFKLNKQNQYLISQLDPQTLEDIQELDSDKQH